MATTGSCACGEIKYEFMGEPAVTALCHCIDCQKWTGGAFTSNAVVPRTAFSLKKGFLSDWVKIPALLTVSGTPKEWDVKGDSGKSNKHFFCSNCGSGLYTELEVMPDMTCVKAGTLDGGAASLGDKVGVEFYTKDRVSYLTPCQGAKQEPVFG